MLTFITGCMGAGKTTAILNRKETVIKPSTDNREGNQNGWGITTPRNCETSISAYYFKDIKEAFREVRGDVIIDEAQFVSIDDVEVILSEADKRNIVCYGLKTTSNGDLFPVSAMLIALADKYEEIESRCEICGEKATAHLLYIDGKPSFENSIVNIEAGEVSYKRVCRHCFLKEKNLWKKSA